MNSLCSGVASCVLVGLWLIPLLAACGSVAARLAVRLGPAAEHRVWITVYLLALFLPAIPTLHHLFPALAFSLPGTPSTPGHGVIRTLLLPSNLPSLTRNPVLFRAITALWLSSVLFFSIRLAWSLLAASRLVRHATPLALTPHVADLWQRCQNAYALPATALVTAQTVQAPLTLSLPHPVLILPAGFADQATDQQLLTALAHECAHIRRHDFRQNLLYELLGVLIAFHPVTALLKARLAGSREMVCDALAVSTLVPRPIYRKSLLRLATFVAEKPASASSHAIGIFDANILEKRIMALNSDKQPSSRSSHLVFTALTFLLLFSTATGLAAAALLFTPAVTNTPADAAGPVYKVGGDVSAPHLIYQKEPEFPDSARNEPASFKGDCILGLTVDSAGIPRNIHVLHSLRKDFDTEAIRAVRQYRFSPALRAARPVAVAVTIDVNFQKF